MGLMSIHKGIIAFCILFLLGFGLFEVIRSFRGTEMAGSNALFGVGMMVAGIVLAIYLGWAWRHLHDPAEPHQ